MVSIVSQHGVRLSSTILVLVSLAATPAVAETGTFRLDPEPLVLPADEAELNGQSTPAVALRPDGGLVTVWVENPIGAARGQARGRWFGPADDGPATESGHFVLSEMDGATGGAALARGSGDSYLAAWRGPYPEFPIFVRGVDGRGQPSGDVQTVALASATPPALAGRPGGDFVATWWERAQNIARLRVAMLGPNGSRLAAIQVAEAPLDVGISRPGIAVTPDGGFTVSWTEAGAHGWMSALRARSYSPAGLPVGPISTLAEVESPWRFGGHDLAAVVEDELLVVWSEMRSGDRALWSLHFHPDGTAAPARRVDAGTRSSVFEVRRASIAGSEDGKATVVWYENGEHNGIYARHMTADGLFRSGVLSVATGPDFSYALPGSLAPESLFANGTDIDRDAEGRIAIAWGLGVHFPIDAPGADSITNRALRVREGDPEDDGPPAPSPPPPHPDAAPLVTAELPGFRTWVVISAGGESVPGRMESECLAETLCVSGRLPGRSEVFVRVPGPKPNHRLWPTIVKLTTSEVEVWIEQVSTGEVEYYRLEGARPGVDELPGLFDREGFPPG